jgi:hypothetical protein
MRDQPPIDVGRDRRAAGLNERYVREWLGAMVTAGVVDVRSGHRSYSAAGRARRVPDARRRGGQHGRVRAVHRNCSARRGRHRRVLQARRRRPVREVPRFHEVMAEDSGQSVLSSLESHILPLVPGLTERLERGIRVLDVGCGRGASSTARRAVSAQPLRRHRPVGRRDRAPTRGVSQGLTTSSSSRGSQRLRRDRRARGLRPHHDVRRDPRSGKPLNVLQGIRAR